MQKLNRKVRRLKKVERERVHAVRIALLGGYDEEFARQMKTGHITGDFKLTRVWSRKESADCVPEKIVLHNCRIESTESYLFLYGPTIDWGNSTFYVKGTKRIWQGQPGQDMGTWIELAQATE